MLDIIPEPHRQTARMALAAAFGATLVTGLRPVTGGASGALTYRVEAGARTCLLRLEPPRDTFRNPHQYACMEAAALAGVAPPLRHVDAAAGVAVMDFLPERPLADYPGGPPALAAAVGRLVARLQDIPAFPPLAGYLDLLDRMLGFVRASALFAPGLLDPHTEAFARIREAYPWDASALVSSHNDPNPRNIIFDGDRLWLIDWETAYRNDPLTDVAIALENLAPTPDLEEALLAAWLGRAPDRRLRARLTLMRSLTRLYYAGLIFSGLAGSPPATPHADLTALSPEGLRDAVMSGRLQVGAPDMMTALGKACLAGFMAGVAAPGFEDALAIARRG